MEDEAQQTIEAILMPLHNLAGANKPESKLAELVFEALNCSDADSRAHALHEIRILAQ